MWTLKPWRMGSASLGIKSTFLGPTWPCCFPGFTDNGPLAESGQTFGTTASSPQTFPPECDVASTCPTPSLPPSTGRSVAGELDGWGQGSRAPSAGQRVSGGAKLAHWPLAGWATRMEGPEGQGLTAGCDSPPSPGRGLHESLWVGG